ncbi:MAG: MGDG synthase family glycosyltransferase [Armatimonadota bacterium]
MSDISAGSLSGRKPKIFIIYANTGGGHLSAAKALQAAILLRHPDQYQVEIVNVPLISGSQRIRLLYESYNVMLRADPRYAKHGLRLLNAFNVERVVMPWVRRGYLNVRKFLERGQPDLIVSVHAILNHSFTRALRECGWQHRIPYVIMCTDLTNNFLRGWANPEATRAITFSETARQQMIEYGMPAEKVVVHNGFAVNPSFFTEPITKEEARAQLGLDPNTFTILVSLGGMAIPRKTAAIVRMLIRSNLPVQLLVICGMNRTLKRKMHYVARTAKIRMHVHGFTQRISLMMSAADLMISKPGPGSIMEAVIKELPLLLDDVTEPMPQEKGNLAFALQHGIACAITSYRQLPRMVSQLMNDHAEYEQMKDNMRRLKNENAIFEVAEEVLSLLPEKSGVG